METALRGELRSWKPREALTRAHLSSPKERAERHGHSTKQTSLPVSQDGASRGAGPPQGGDDRGCPWSTGPARLLKG